MKAISYRATLILALCLGLLAVKSCTNKEDAVQSENSPPVAPTMDPVTGAPPNGAHHQLTRPVLSWKCSDADGDPLSFDLYLGTDPAPPLFAGGHLTYCIVPGPLAFNTTYYWYVVARDDHGHETRSDTWSFRTRADVLQCDASADTLIGPPPLAVRFTSEASEGVPPYIFHWQFGDGESSNLQNPPHEYMQPGTFSAVLKVTDGEQSTCSKAIEVVIEGPPVCSGLAVPEVGPPPLEVGFVGTATGGKSPYTFRWDFGDGYTSDEQYPYHTYPHPGDYLAIFEVTGADGRVCTSPVSVTVGPLLSCDATANPSSGPLPLIVRFTGQASGGKGPYTFLWTFGDGTSSSSQNPVHTYNRSGPFTAVLTVGDSGSSTCSKSIRIVAGS